MLLLKNILTVRASLRLAALVTLASTLSPSFVLGQTYSSCNPLQQSGCPANPALGKSVAVDFRSGASDQFTALGNPTYDSNGASFTVAHSGDAPQLTSNWYIMFGKVEITMKAAPGAGIVSSSVLQSDDLDEIDWEWLGAQDSQVQSNYFGKGQTTTYDRAAVHAVTGAQDGFHTYTVDWTDSQIVWQIDGTTVRVLQSSAANGQFPQTPMRFKIGAWSGGDPSNPQGTIAWAQGPTNYADGPFTMVVQSVSVTDYSTGSQYTYSGTTGDWTSITAVGGAVNANAGGASGTDTAAPAITSTSPGNVVPFDGTHRSDSTYTTPNIYPWVPDATTLASATVTNTNYPGLPSGWTVNASGKVVPPSSAAPPTYPYASSTSSPALSPAAFCSALGHETLTSYNQQGFLTTVTIISGASIGYNDNGFPTTVMPSACSDAAPPQAGVGLATTSAIASEDASGAVVVNAKQTAETVKNEARWFWMALFVLVLAFCA